MFDVYFLVVDCGPLPDPPNGMVQQTGTFLGSVTTYSCSTGFKLLNEENRTCGADGEWTGVEGICIGMREVLVKSLGGKEGERERERGISRGKERGYFLC